MISSADASIILISSIKNIARSVMVFTWFRKSLYYSDLQLGAHANNRLNSRRNGYESQWDSKDGQRSIILGATHAKRGGYRSIKAIMSYGKTHKNSY